MNDADRLSLDPVMRWIVGGHAVTKQAASTSQMGRFETEVLATEENLAALAADFDVPPPFSAGRSPSGRRTARASLRVETLMSIRFSAHLPSQSSSFATVQLGRGISLPPLPRTRGRRTLTLPPLKPIGPSVAPQRWPLRSLARSCRAPHSACVSSYSISSSATMPEIRQKRSKLARTS